ncbi:MAG: hypothetical protein FWC27_12900 [Firmicutes bacterium]|nr:hypothetical protein [Bacillota bacterium]
MPKAWWWVPGVFIAVWAAFLATVRLRGLVVPEMKKINRFINGAGIAEIAVAVLLLVFRLHDLYGAILIGGIVFVALALVLVFPMIFWVVAAHLICPLLVRERISCSSKWVHCDTQLSNRRKVSIFYVRFDGDPAEYRVGWLYYRKCKRAALGGRFTYEKCVCPMGVSWIRNVREWG